MARNKSAALPSDKAIGGSIDLCPNFISSAQYIALLIVSTMAEAIGLNKEGIEDMMASISNRKLASLLSVLMCQIILA